MKNSTITFIIIILILIAGAVYLSVVKNKSNPTPEPGNENMPIGGNQAAPATEGNAADLVSFSVKPNQEVSGTLNFEGVVKNAYFFEANIIVQVVDVNKNILKTSHATATTDWMTTGPVSFEGSIDLSGLPSGPAYLRIANDNASGLPENDKWIDIPIIIGS